MYIYSTAPHIHPFIPSATPTDHEIRIRAHDHDIQRKLGHGPSPFIHHYRESRFSILNIWTLCGFEFPHVGLIVRSSHSRNHSRAFESLGGAAADERKVSAASFAFVLPRRDGAPWVGNRWRVVRSGVRVPAHLVGAVSSCFATCCFATHCSFVDCAEGETALSPLRSRRSR